MKKRIKALKEFIKQTYNGHHPVLNVAGSKGLHERTHIAFVPRVELAQELAKYCKRYLNVNADYTYGGDPDFDSKKEALSNGELQMLFSCRKITEGFDVKEVNCVWGLWPLPEQSEWLLKQMIGRGLRFNADDPDDDCLFIDGTYNGDRHDLASALGIFGVYQNFQGGLLAPGAVRSLEGKIFTLLQEGYDSEDIPNNLTRDELSLAQRLGWKFPLNITSNGNGSTTDISNENVYISGVTLVERNDVRTQLAFKNREEMLELAREVLAENGYKDRDSLLRAKTTTFINQKFFPFGKGVGLCSTILRRSLGKINQSILNEVTNELFQFNEGQEKTYTEQQIFDALTSNGYTDRTSFLSAKSNIFIRQDFPPFGKGFAFCSKILNRKFERVTISLLKEIADMLFPPDEAEEARVREQYLSALARNGYTNRTSLLRAFTRNFQSQDFGFFENGRSFCSLVLNRPVTLVNKHILQEVADMLFPPDEAEEARVREQYLSALARNGYTNRTSLLRAKSSVFTSQDFPPFGKGIAFCSEILSRVVNKTTKSIIQEVANELFPE